MKHALLSFILCLLTITCFSFQRYQTPEKVIITGKVLNQDSTKNKLHVAINRVGTGEQDELEIEIEKTGEFNFEFYTYLPTDIWVNYKRNFLITAHPKDSMHMIFDGSKNSRIEVLQHITFIGDRSKTNEEITAFQFKYYSSKLYNDGGHKNSAISDLDPVQFRQYVDSLQNQRLIFGEKFIKQNKVSRESGTWIKNFLLGNYISDLTWYPDNHMHALNLTKGQWDVPESYYNYFSTTKFSFESLTGAHSISSYINVYLYRYCLLLTKNKIEASGLKYSHELKDSVMFQTIIEETKDSPLLRELTLCQYLNNRVKTLEIDEIDNNLLNLINDYLTLPYLKEPLLETYNKTVTSLRDSELSLNLKQKVAPDNEIIKIIRTNHSNKVVYIDLWATWCAPCLQEFPYSKALQKEMKAIDFVYLCIDSKETTYENVLKKYELDGTHYYLNNEQSIAIRKDLNVRGIPHYLIINKSGEIIKNDSHLKPSYSETKQILQKLISD